MTIPMSIPATGLQREPLQAVPRVAPTPRLPLAAVAVASIEADPPVSGPTPEDSLVAEINQKLKLASIGVQFELDRETDTMIVRVVDVHTGELIRQMPSEEIVQLSKVLGKLNDLLAHQAICRKALLNTQAGVPAPARWSNSWGAAAGSPDTPSFKSVKV
jgi:flagellar protein FlaG